jgi:hypothetical protein
MNAGKQKHEQQRGRTCLLTNSSKNATEEKSKHSRAGGCRLGSESREQEHQLNVLLSAVEATVSESRIREDDGARQALTVNM